MAQPAPAIRGPAGAKANGNGATAQHQRFVLTDPVAFKYLEEDPSTDVLARNQKLAGYECYLVEQWACSRTDPTFIITTYTGDSKHRIVVNVLSVPTDESTWSPRLTVYFKALEQYHAKRRQTPLGTIMITNLSGFPSSFTVIPVPDGDIRSHREDFYINEDLKRLGCSGRVGISLNKPNTSTVNKFYQLYRVSEKIPFNGAVVELVKLCQVALSIFGKLEADYADGLLCDMTEKAVGDWWVDIGSEYYNVEPHDGILGPTTVSALLGMLMGARNRLHAYGAPISKDVFDLETTKRAIAHFQKSARIQKSRRLDRQTLAKLHRVTNKAISKEGWIVPRAVKSTVAELSGKGGEMVMEMVGARDKAGIAEAETVDLEHFIGNIQGERLKWLWRGKPRKSTTGDSHRKNTDDGLIFQSNDQGGYEWSRRKRPSMDSGQEDNDSGQRGKLSKRPVERGASLKSPEAASRGFHIIKGAVPGLRHHSGRQSKDDGVPPDAIPRESMESGRYPVGESSDVSTKPPPFESKPSGLSEQSFSILAPAPTFTNTIAETPSDLAADVPTFLEHVEPPSDEEDKRMVSARFSLPPSRSPSLSPAPSIAGSTYRGIDLDALFEHSHPPEIDVGTYLKRSNSFSGIDGDKTEVYAARWGRRMSFAIAEDAVLHHKTLTDSCESKQSGLATSDFWAEVAMKLRRDLLALSTPLSTWVHSELDAVQNVNHVLALDIDSVQRLYQDYLESHKKLSSDSKEVMDFERRQLTEQTKEIEVLGQKLEYEINGLRGNVEDVEDAVDEFERQVRTAENKVSELEKAMMPKESWGQWVLRVVTGHGKTG